MPILGNAAIPIRRAGRNARYQIVPSQCSKPLLVSFPLPLSIRYAHHTLSGPTATTGSAARPWPVWEPPPTRPRPTGQLTTGTATVLQDRPFQRIAVSTHRHGYSPAVTAVGLAPHMLVAEDALAASGASGRASWRQTRPSKCRS